MSQFSHLAKARVAKDKQAKFEFSGLEGQPYLMVLSATEHNKDFFNAALRNVRKRKTVKNIDTTMLQKLRDSDKVMYPKYIIKSWGDVVNTGGKPVVYNDANIKEFLDNIPSDMFDELRDFCQDPRNFSLQSIEDSEELEKN